jgi:hypothetical protein
MIWFQLYVVIVGLTFLGVCWACREEGLCLGGGDASFVFLVGSSIVFPVGIIYVVIVLINDKLNIPGLLLKEIKFKK